MPNIIVTTQPTMSSRQIAELTGKRHPDVTRDIKAQLGRRGLDVSKFAHIYLDSRNREKTEYMLDEDNANLLVLGYDPMLREALYFQWKAMKAELEAKHLSRLEAKTGYAPMTLAIMQDHDPAKGYHYSNEADMINRIVTGMSAKQYRAEYDVDSVRDNMSPGQLEITAKLQARNTIYIEDDVPFKERKELLKKYVTNKLNFSV